MDDGGWRMEDSIVMPAACSEHVGGHLRLFREFITTEQIEIAGPGGDFDGLESLADRGCILFYIYKIGFSIIIPFRLYYRESIFAGLV